MLFASLLPKRQPMIEQLELLPQSTIRIETGRRERFGKPCSARAGREWNFPSAPEPVVKVRRVFIERSVVVD